MPVKNKELNSALDNDWAIQLTQAPCKEPTQFCLGFWCCNIAGYLQRKDLLELTGEPYYCFAGLCPCGPCGKPCNENCIYLECCLCPYMMITGNRFMIQTRFSIRNGWCDEFILTCMCIVSYTICILELVGYDVPNEIELIVELIMDIIWACMHAQQHHQIQLVKEQIYQPPKYQVIQLLPPVQQEMILQGKKGGSPGIGTPGMHVVGAPQQQMMGQQPPQFGQPQPNFQVVQQPVYYQQQGGGGGQPVYYQQQGGFQGQAQPVYYQQPGAQQVVYVQQGGVQRF